MLKSNTDYTRTIWMTGPDLSQSEALARDIETDVCIVGSGIAGLTTAYLLQQQGISTVVIDAGAIGGGQTTRTSAHLVNQMDDRYYFLQHVFGDDGARLAAESHTRAIDRIETIATTEGIDCDFTRVNGYLFLDPSHKVDELEKELKACHECGLTDVQLVEKAPYETWDSGPCLLFPRQAEFHITKYLAGLVRAIQNKGGQLYSMTAAEKIEGGQRPRVKTKNGSTISAAHVVVATNTPINDRVAIHTKQAPYRTFVIGASVPSGSVPHILAWDTGDPYHYLRVVRQDDGSGDASREILLIGGEDHKTGQHDDAGYRFGKLEAWARTRFPQIAEIVYRWSGQIMETIDGLAFIGRDPEGEKNVYVATGDSGMGLTHGTIAGILLTDLIRGRDNPWSRIYDPSRKKLGGAKAWAEENLNVVAQYAEWVEGGDVKSTEEIPRGSGAVLVDGTHRVAAYRDEDGTLHEHSAVCPHLSCIVRWNSAEKSWDCPCHGSRFDAYGHVVNGPANSDLKEIEVASEKT